MLLSIVVADALALQYQAISNCITNSKSVVPTQYNKHDKYSDYQW